MAEQRHLAMARLRVGGRQSDVDCELGVSQSVISRLASRHRTTGRVHDRPRIGYLRTYALRHRHATSTQLQSRLRDMRGTRVSRQTIRNRLHRFGLNARRPLQWAQDHVTWTMQQWSTVLFTDECRFINVSVIQGALCSSLSSLLICALCSSVLYRVTYKELQGVNTGDTHPPLIRYIY
uniref:Transposase Tc1-like domain-containing protein n=1 Tax=Paramormyrops kingsleyae TaxID=1676925 RepID=A0A3B3QRF8_9TELE